MINQCFYHFKHLYKDLEKRKGGEGVLATSQNFVNTSNTGKNSFEVKNLEEEV